RGFSEHAVLCPCGNGVVMLAFPPGLTRQPISIHLAACLQGAAQITLRLSSNIRMLAAEVWRVSPEDGVTRSTLPIVVLNPRESESLSDTPPSSILSETWPWAPLTMKPAASRATSDCPCRSRKLNWVAPSIIVGLSECS